MADIPGFSDGVEDDAEENSVSTSKEANSAGSGDDIGGGGGGGAANTNVRSVKFASLRKLRERIRQNSSGNMLNLLGTTATSFSSAINNSHGGSGSGRRAPPARATPSPATSTRQQRIITNL